MSSTIDRESMRMWRHKHRLTQAEAAALIGVTRVSYQNWEHGHHQPQPKNAAKVIAAMARDGIQAGGFAVQDVKIYTLSESQAVKTYTLRDSLIMLRDQPALGLFADENTELGAATE